MQRRISIFFVLMTFTLAGCAALFPQKELIRVDEGMQYTMNFGGVSGTAIFHKFLLPEKRTISKIVIYPQGKVKNLAIYIQQGKDNWKLLKQIKKPIRSPYEISTMVSTDGIRIIQTTVSRGELESIELYGYK